MSVISNHPKMSMKHARDQNLCHWPLCNECDVQNNAEAVTCFLNSLDKELHEDVWTRIEPDVLFAEVFMIFIQHERPQNGETYNLLEQKLVNFDTTLNNCAGSDIREICGDVRKTIKALVQANQHNSKHNSRVCCLLIEAGGQNNKEFTLPLHIKLKEVKTKVMGSSHLNCQDKLHHMATKLSGCKNAFQLAEDLCTGMIAEGNI